MEVALSDNDAPAKGQEQEQDDLFDGLDGGNTDDSGSDESAPQDGGTPDPKDSKRVNDLMSKWQSEQARANRLEAELAAAKGQQKGDAGDGTASDGAGNEFVEFQRELTRKALFDSDPRFAAYGLDPSAIEGQTVAEMRASVERQKKLVDAVETKARNKALREHGIAPDAGAGSGGSAKPVDYDSMSKEDFEKALAKGLRR